MPMLQRKKDEKKVEKLIIRLGNTLSVVRPEEKQATISENAGEFTSSIADKVKLRKRGQAITSDAMSKLISVSSLPVKRRKRKTTVVSSIPASSDSSLISPTPTSPLPSKKAKLSDNYPLNNEKSNTAISVMDINQLDVASYEEVSSVEAVNASSESVPPDYFGVNSIPEALGSDEDLRECNSLILHLQKDTICESLCHRDSAMTVIASLDVSEELTYLDPSDVENFFSGLKTFPGEESADVKIDKILTSLLEAAKIFCSKEKSSVDVFPAIEHSTNKILTIKDEKIMTDLSSRMNSRDSIKPPSRLSGHASSSETRVRVYKKSHNNMGIYSQENQSTEEREAEMKRHTVYVGNIPPAYSVEQLRERFQKFGAIKNIRILPRDRCYLNCSNGHSSGSEELRKYGFIKFSCIQEASRAIEYGNKGHNEQLNLSYGGRRQFVGVEYKDLDGNDNLMNERDYRSSSLPQNIEDDFDFILKKEMHARGVKPQPFTMKCRA